MPHELCDALKSQLTRQCCLLAQHDLQRQLDDAKRRGEQDRREATRQVDAARERAAELTAEVRAEL